MRHHLRAERGGGAVQKSLSVTELHRLTDGYQDLHTFIYGLLEGLGNDSRVDSWQEKQSRKIMLNVLSNKHNYDK